MSLSDLRDGLVILGGVGFVLWLVTMFKLQSDFDNLHERERKFHADLDRQLGEIRDEVWKQKRF